MCNLAQERGERADVGICPVVKYLMQEHGKDGHSVELPASCVLCASAGTENIVVVWCVAPIVLTSPESEAAGFCAGGGILNRLACSKKRQKKERANSYRSGDESRLKSLQRSGVCRVLIGQQHLVRVDVLSTGETDRVSAAGQFRTRREEPSAHRIPGILAWETHVIAPHDRLYSSGCSAPNTLCALACTRFYLLSWPPELLVCWR